MKTLTKENNSLKEVRETIREFGKLGSVSLKHWEQVTADEESVEVVRSNGLVTTYQNAHGTFGFGTSR